MKKRKKGSSPGSRKNGSREATLQGCQVEKCSEDLSDAKKYHRRHKVCEAHAKAPTVIIAGIRQRFCQQCSRFHEVGEFDESKRSCRRRLAGHNERRRKSGTSDYYGENSRRGRQGLLRRRKVNDGNRTKEAESRLLYLGINLIKQLDDRRREALSLSLSHSQLAPSLLSYLAFLTYFHLQALPYLANDSVNKLHILRSDRSPERNKAFVRQGDD